MKNRNIYLLNLLVFFNVSGIISIILPFLTDNKFNLIDKCIVLCIGSFICIIVQVLCGLYSDKTNRFKRIFIVLYFIFVIALIGMLNVNSNIMLIVFTSITSGFTRIILSFLETWDLFINKENYGRYRALGAFGYFIGALSLSFVFKNYNRLLLISIILVVSILIYYFISSYKDKVIEKKIELSDIKELLMNKRYLLLLFTLFFIYSIGSVDQFIVIDKLIKLDAGKFAVGSKFALQAMFEIPVFYFMTNILKKMKPINLLLLAIIGYSLKFFLYASFNSVFLIIATSILQLVTLPLVMISSKLIVNDEVKGNISSSAQMITMAVFIGLSGIVMPIITTIVSMYFNLNASLYFTSFICVVPLASCLVYKKIK